MSDTGATPTSAPEPNAFLKFVQRPRIILLMLATWSLLTVITEAANQNGVFMDIRIDEIDGALGGLGLAWQGIPLAVLYIDSFRNPTAHRRIFWLAIVHMGAAIAANVYHLGKGDFSFESIVLPVSSAAALFVLSFMQIFQATAPPEPPPTPELA